MAVETTYTSLREGLSGYLDQVSDDREVVFVRRRGARDVAMVAAEELEGLLETAYLLRSPKNAERLMKALEASQKGKRKAESIESLRLSVGLEKTTAAGKRN
jgi:antitoxin YefM